LATGNLKYNLATGNPKYISATGNPKYISATGNLKYNLATGNIGNKKILKYISAIGIVLDCVLKRLFFV